MNLQTEDIIQATMNFAGNPNDGGKSDSIDESRTQIDLAPRDCRIKNARTLSPAASIATQGFTLAKHTLDNPRWDDDSWIDAVYTPSCGELVKQLTGARQTVSFHRPMQRSSDRNAHGSHLNTAGFIHIDNPRATGRDFAEWFASQHGVKFEQAAIYNVWKATTPPPQDQPLAVADWRTVPSDSHVIGHTIDGGVEVPYVIIKPTDAIDFYYFPDMTCDESIVFTGVDLRPDKPLGCAHSAFRNPTGGVARASIEARVIAIFA